jgi:hypothetical protein
MRLMPAIAVQLDAQHSMAERLGLRPQWVIVELNADRKRQLRAAHGLSLVRDTDPLVDWKSPRLDHSFRRLLAEWRPTRSSTARPNGLPNTRIDDRRLR